jgi:hypothetical protein
MEAPEKIFVPRNASGVLSNSWYLEPDRDLENVEYIRKDVFIEKACEWLKFNYVEFTDNSELGLNINELIKDFKKDFRKAMEE